MKRSADLVERCLVVVYARMPEPCVESCLPDVCKVHVLGYVGTRASCRRAEIVPSGPGTKWPRGQVYAQ